MKKLKYYKLFVATGVLVMGASSCTKDFLEVEPYGKSSIESYYKTDAEAISGTIAAYDIISSDMFQGWASPMLTRLLCSDETKCGGSGPSDQPMYQDIDKFTWLADNAGFRAYYSKGYYGIYRCNAVITSCVGDSPIRKRSIAEAKFLRAYYLLELTTAFGPIPMPLVPAASLDVAYPRESRATVYAQIVKDLNEAIVDLPNKSSYSAVDKFRASKQAAQALLGKTYLYSGDNAKAITAFESVMATESTEVGLEANFADVTMISSEFGMESLFEANFAKSDKNWGTVAWDRGADDNRHIQLGGPRSITNNSLGIIGGWGFFPPTKQLSDDLDSADPRKELTILSKEDLLSKYGGVFEDGWDTQGFIRTKYTTYASQSDGGNGNTIELNYGTNWRLIRYADVLLMAAEAYQKTGANSNALIAINKVRARVGLAPAATTGSATFDLIVKERQIELAYEGHRYFDLVRWSNEGLLTDAYLASKFGSAWKPMYKLFPIPTDEMTTNTLIGSQNAGY